MMTDRKHYSQLSDVCPRPEDLVSAVEMSESVEELEALLSSLKEQLMVLRGKDSGGEPGNRDRSSERKIDSRY